LLLKDSLAYLDQDRFNFGDRACPFLYESIIFFVL